MQGVGFRPFLWRLARALRLSGWVVNDAAGVTAEVQGPQADVERLVAELSAAAPPLAVVERVQVEQLPIVEPACLGFAILESGEAGTGTTAVPPDIALCPACLADISSPGNRRYGHPFATCTDCGPRWTIILDLPYDRSATTMRGFGMCPACAAEYADPADRRFHAQPIACPGCGPVIWFAPSGSQIQTDRPVEGLIGMAALEAARQRLRRGETVAIKGLGGFHLACDATNAAAVARLRNRKLRLGKPLAVMVENVAAALSLCHADAQEHQLLSSRERPIVLLRRREFPGGASPLAAAVAPDQHFLGVMLPATPLHQLLCSGMPTLVMTSGNLAEEPIIHDNLLAAERLGPLADAFLMHDRPISAHCDDSVVRMAAGAVLPIRRSRGYCPLPIPLAGRAPCVLAVGGELKATLCLTQPDRALLGPHIGDMGNPDTLAALSAMAAHLMHLFRVRPEGVATDLHPGYLSAEWARRFAAEAGLPLVAIQHHHAHLASLVAEQGGVAAIGQDKRTLLGVCFDGTGYGLDGTIWGGEFFQVRLPLDAASVREPHDLFERVAHLQPFDLPGGDACIRHPCRAAVALLSAGGLAWDDRLPAVAALSATEQGVLRQALVRRLNCTPTSSIGRLFDAVAALAGVRQSITYEAEAALCLEALAGDDDGSAYSFTLAGRSPLVIGWQSVIEAVVHDVLSGISTRRIAARFHRGVARMIAAVCRRLQPDVERPLVGLTGGVFQNALLLELTLAELQSAGCEVLIHHLVPANDGGLSLGQAALARLFVGRDF